MKLKFIFLILIIPAQLLSQTPHFGGPINMGLIEHDEINEASGLAASRKNPNVLWTHNDSGGANRIFALNTHGKHLGIYYIGGFLARDWEDIAVGPGPVEGEHYIFIGDIGDNRSRYENKYIYRFIESEVSSNQCPEEKTLTHVETIVFRYPDGPRDAEALLIDTPTKDIYIITKREDSVRVYRAPYPQSTTEILTLEKVATLNLTQVVAGDISVSGYEILIKNYDNIFYWQRDTCQDLWQVFSTTPDTLPYTPEVKGESVCWNTNGKGYYTVSEELYNTPAHLYFYPRLDTTAVNFLELPPSFFSLKQNFPNPFNQATTISYSIKQPGHIQLVVYNELGKKISQLVNREKDSGEYFETWNGKNTCGNYVASGVYFYSLINENNLFESKRMLFVK